jgi:hypothetical protein
LVCNVAAAGWLFYRAMEVGTAPEKLRADEKALASRLQDLNRREQKLRADQAATVERANALVEKGEEFDRQRADIKARTADLEKRIEEDEDKRRNTTYALDLVSVKFDAVRSTFEEQQRLDRARIPARNGDSAAPLAEALSTKASIPSLDRLGAQFRMIEGIAPTEGPDIGGRIVALHEIAAAYKAHVARGSLGSYTLQAKLEVELEILRDLARRLGLPPEVIPANLFELLDAPKLTELEAIQTRKVAELRAREAVTPGLAAASVEHERAVLKQIETAKAKRPADPASIFAKAILEKHPSAADITHLQNATSDSAKEASVRLLEAQLLAKDLALDPYNIPVRVRLETLREQLPDAERARFHELDTQFAVLDRIRAASPKDPAELRAAIDALAKKPDSVREAVREFVEARVSDPARAAELMVQLASVFERETGKRADQAAAEFHRWQAGHLTRGQLYGLLAGYVGRTLDCVARVSALGLDAKPHPDDRAELESLRDSLTAEYAERPKSDDPAVVRLRTDWSADAPPAQEVYNELRKTLARTPSFAVRQAFRERALDGLQEQVKAIDSARADIDRAVKSYNKAVTDLKDLGEPTFVDDFRNERALLVEGLKSVELRLSEIAAEAPENARVKQLLERVKAGLGGQPPPVDGSPPQKAAWDWADPAVTKAIRAAKTEVVGEVHKATKDLLDQVKAVKMSVELAELSYHFHGEYLPHEFAGGKQHEQFQGMTRVEKVKAFAGVFRGLYDTTDMEALNNSLKALKNGTIAMPQYPAFRDYVDDGATLLGQDKLGREYYRINGAVRVLHKTVDGGVMNCPVYIK